MQGGLEDRKHSVVGKNDTTKLENEYEVKEMVTFPQTITCERIICCYNGSLLQDFGKYLFKMNSE
jgi:hypothetical protein